MNTILSQESMKSLNKYAKKHFINKADGTINDQAVKEWLEVEVNKNPDNKDQIVALTLSVICGCVGLALTFSLAIKVFVWVAIKTNSWFWTLFAYYMTFATVGGASFVATSKVAENSESWSNDVRLYFRRRKAFSEARNELKHSIQTI